jgi:hypothetical protein
MTFTKRKLADAQMGYAVSKATVLGRERILAASEEKGPAVVFDGPRMEPRVIATEPGGTMGFAAVPGRDDALFVITGFYPVFEATTAGIHLYQATDGLSQPWRGERVIELPYVHRIGSVATPIGDYLLGATVCGGKEYRDDWSKPGAVHAYPIPVGLDGPWEPQTILEGIHRNHGLGFGRVDGVDSLLISGTEGLFALALPGAEDAEGRPIEPWRVTTLLGHEVSEMGLIDFDGDGEAELAVVEPFHGDTFSVYKNGSNGWDRVYSAELDFGHGLSVGTLAGEPVATVGNRGGSKNLVCFRPVSTGPFAMEQIVVDEGPATAGTTIAATADGDGIVASNPEFAEYALYLAREDA